MAVVRRVVFVRGVSYPSDLAEGQWELLGPVFNALGNGGRGAAVRGRAAEFSVW